MHCVLKKKIENLFKIFKKGDGAFSKKVMGDFIGVGRPVRDGIFTGRDKILRNKFLEDGNKQKEPDTFERLSCRK